MDRHPTDRHRNPPEAAISRRWKQSEDQVAGTAAALRTGRLDLANTPQEVDRRRARLGRYGLDLEAIVGHDDSLWVTFLSRGLTAARAVGRVVEAPPRQPAVPVGTGVLVAPRLLLTNNHVVETPDDATAMAVQFGYEFADDGSELPYQTYRLDPAAGWFTDPELDFTVVAVAERDGVPAGKTYGVVTLIEQTGKALKGESLNVVHHPGGDRKRISIRENRMVAEDDLWVRYTSDARRGSSGAPVFNDQWEMVALHHGGIARRDDAGNRITRTGGIWTEDMGVEAVDYAANEGARVSRIIRRLRAADLDRETRALVTEALEAGEAEPAETAGGTA